jgi:ribosome biogenesis protein MAK21
MVYKNPKKQRDDVNTALGTKGSSIMQPMAAHRGTSIMLKKSGGNDVNVNTEAFWQKKIEDVPVDQAFFHKYFTQKKILKPTTGKKAAKSAGSDDDEDDFGGSKKRGIDADDDGEDGSDMDEDEVWNAMMSDMPKDAMEDVDEDDEDLSDGELEELMLSDLEDEEGAGDEDDEDEDEDEIDEESFGKDESNWKDDDGDDEEANMFMDEEDDMVASDEEVAAEESDQEEKGKHLSVYLCLCAICRFMTCLTPRFPTSPVSL